MWMFTVFERRFLTPVRAEESAEVCVSFSCFVETNRSLMFRLINIIINIKSEIVRVREGYYEQTVLGKWKHKSLSTLILGLVLRK